MYLKSKLFGFTAASILALSMTTGVMADEPVVPADSTKANVTLNTGSCSMSITTTDFAFDNLTWDGDEWSNDAPDKTISGSVTNGQPDQICTVLAASTGLHHEDGTGSGQIDLTVGTKLMSETPQAVHASDTGLVSLAVVLGDAGIEDQAGSYEGTISLSMPNGD